MIKKSIILLFLLVVCSVKSYSEIPAGIPGEFLRWGIGGKALGMGRAFVGQADDATAPYWNPAGLASVRRWEVSAANTFLLSDVHLSHFATAIPILKKHGLAVGINGVLLWTGGIERWEWQGNDMVQDLDGDFTWTQSAFLVSAGYPFFIWNSMVEVGATTKYLHRSLRGTDHAIGFDFGTRFRYSKLPLSFGIQLQNVYISKFGKDSLPFGINTGISWFFPFYPAQSQLRLNCDFFFVNYKNKWYIDPRVGLDYKFSKFSSIRLGFSTGSENYWNIAFGLGLRWGGFSSQNSFAFDFSSGLAEDLGINSFVPRPALSFHGKENFRDMLEEAKKLLSSNFTENKYKIKYLLLRVTEASDNLNQVIEATILLGDLAYKKCEFNSALKHYHEAISLGKNFGDVFDYFETQGDSTTSYLRYLNCLIHEFYPTTLKAYFVKDLVPAKKILDYQIADTVFAFETKDTTGERIFKRELVKFMQNLAKDASNPDDFTASAKAFESILHTCSDDSKIKEVIRFNYYLSLWETGESRAVDSLYFFVKKCKIFDLSCYWGIEQQLVEEVAWSLFVQGFHKYLPQFSSYALEWAKKRFYEPVNDSLRVIDTYFKANKKSGMKETADNDTFLPNSLPDLDFKQVSTSSDSFKLPWQIIRGNANDFYLSEYGTDKIAHLDSNLAVIQKYSTGYEGPAGLVVLKSPVSECEGLVAFPKKNLIRFGKFSNLEPFFKRSKIVLNQTKSDSGIPYARPTGFRVYRDSLLFVLDSENKRLIEYPIFPDEEYWGLTENSEFSIRTEPACSLGLPVSFDFHPRKNEIFVADLKSRKIIKGVFLDSLVLKQYFEAPENSHYFWFPVWVQTVFENDDAAYVYVIFRAEPAGKQNLLIKYNTEGQPVAKRWIDKSVFSCFIESSGQTSVLYLPERNSNGRIRKYLLMR